MAGPVLVQNFIGYRLARLLAPFLKNGLRIVEQKLPLQIGEHVLQNKIARYRHIPAVQIHGTDHRLHDIGGNGILAATASCLLALSKADKALQINISGTECQRRLTDKGGPDLCQLAFPLLRIFLIQEFTRNHLQNCIAQKFQPLIILVSANTLLIGIGGMRQGTLKQIPVPKSISDPAFQFTGIRSHHFRHPFLSPFNPNLR